MFEVHQLHSELLERQILPHNNVSADEHAVNAQNVGGWTSESNGDQRGLRFNMLHEYFRKALNDGTINVT